MTTAGHRLVVNFTRLWVRFYTIGLTPELRQARWDEIDSDIWEQVSHDSRRAGPAHRTVLHVGVRCLLGVPADISWRFEQPSSRTMSKEESHMQRTAGQNSWTVVATGAFALVLVATAVAVLVINRAQSYGADEFIVPTSVLMTLTFPLLAIALGCIAGGFRFMRKAPGIGAALAVGGFLTLGVMFSWMILPPLIGIGLSVYAVRRARRLTVG